MALDAPLLEAFAESLRLLHSWAPRGHTPGLAGGSTEGAPRVTCDDLRTPEHSVVASHVHALRTGSYTAAELVADLLAAADALDGALHAYVTRFDDAALAAARRSDMARSRGEDHGPLHGLPVAVKDVLATAEAVTRSNTGLTSAHLDRTDAAVIRELRKSGAVILGKTSTMELASGMPSMADPEPVPRNPWNTDYWPGGSSSGSAAGVAARLFPAALGSDTAGSVRIPSALCGITGLKPSHDPRSLVGVLPLSPTMDTVGPMAESAVDCLLLLETLHPDRSEVPGEGVQELAGTRVAVERSRFESHEVHPDVRAAFNTALAKFVDLGVEVVDIELPFYETLRVAARVIWTTDAFFRYGEFLESVREPTRDLLQVGAMASRSDYVAALRVRDMAVQVLTSQLQPFVALLSPTRTCPAPLVTEATTAWQMSTHNHTSIWNLVGFPAVSVPMGITEAGLPMGLQIVGPRGHDRSILAVAAHYQAATTWHRMRPPVAHQPLGEEGRASSGPRMPAG